MNLNGNAFRDARILPAYLDARLAELKWAVVAQELRLKEREEQRRIKEQIREEEKARREYERAMQEAAKEEDMLRRAMGRLSSRCSKPVQNNELGLRPNFRIYSRDSRKPRNGASAPSRWLNRPSAVMFTSCRTSAPSAKTCTRSD